MSGPTRLNVHKSKEYFNSFEIQLARAYGFRVKRLFIENGSLAYLYTFSITIEYEITRINYDEEITSRGVSNHRIR